MNYELCRNYEGKSEAIADASAATAACCLLPATLWGVVANFNSPKPEHRQADRVCPVCEHSAIAAAIPVVFDQSRRAANDRTKPNQTKAKRRRNESQSID